MAPTQDVHDLIPRTCECYLFDIRDFADEITDFEIGGYPGLSRWTSNIITIGSCKREAKSSKSVVEDMMEMRDLRDVREGARAKERRDFLEADKAREQILP